MNRKQEGAGRGSCRKINTGPAADIWIGCLSLLFSSKVGIPPIRDREKAATFERVPECRGFFCFCRATFSCINEWP